MNRHRGIALVLLAALVMGAVTLLGLGWALVARGAAAAHCSCGITLANNELASTLPRALGIGTLAATLILTFLVVVRARRGIHRSRTELTGERVGRRTLFGIRVHVISGALPRAYCVGGWRATVVVTTGFLGLPNDEQWAVLAHERAHAKSRDPMAFAVLDALAKTVPPLAPLAVEFRRQAEFAADDAARAVAGDRAFGSALARSIEAVPGSVAAFSPTEARVRRFLGRPYGQSRKPLFAAALGFLAVASILTGTLLGARRVTAREAAMCPFVAPAICRMPLSVVCFSTPTGTACLVP